MSKMITITASQDAFAAAIPGLETKAADYLGRAAEMLHRGKADDQDRAQQIEDARAHDLQQAEEYAADVAALREERQEVIAGYRDAWRNIHKLIHAIRGRDASDASVDALWDDRIKDALHWLPRQEADKTEAASIVETITLHAAILDSRAIDLARGLDVEPWTDIERAPLADATDRLRRRLDVNRSILARMAGTTVEEIAAIEAGEEPAAPTVKMLLAIARDARTMTSNEVYERYCPDAPGYIAPPPDRVEMTGADVRDARGVLGFAWGYGRPLSMSELGRALQLSEANANETVKKWEAGKGPTGPAATAIQAWLDAAAGKPVKPRTDFVRPMGPKKKSAD